MEHQNKSLMVRIEITSPWGDETPSRVINYNNANSRKWLAKH